MAVTIKEIAEYANVSRGTVDRALHGRGGVKPEVERRILAIAENMGYKPNSVAKALSNLKKKMTIGLLLPSVKNPFFADLIQGAMDAQKALTDYGVEIRLTEMRGYDPEEQLKKIDEIISQKIDILALTPFDDERIAKKIDEIAVSGIKVFTINSDIYGTKRCCYIGTDFINSGKLAAGLIGLINRKAKVLIVNGSPQLLSQSQRVKGFLDTIKGRYKRVNVADVVVCHENDYRAYDLVRERLKEDSGIDMVYIVGEGICGTCQAISEFEDRRIDVVCYDDVAHTKELFYEGKISATICQQPYQQGYHAVQQCLNWFIEASDQMKEKVLLENVIKIRESFFE